MKSFSTFWGATFIVAGTTIGAGMLALPLVSLNLGMGWTTLLLLGLWAFMLENALVYVKNCEDYDETVSVAEMAGHHLGSAAKMLGNLAIIGLFLSLLSAYVAGGSAILVGAFESQLGNMKEIVTILFSTAMGLILFFDMRVTDFYNRIFFGLKIALFFMACLMIYRAVPEVSLYKTPNNFSVNSFVVAVGVYFTSFGFHGSIPTLIKYMQKNNKNLHNAFIIGSLLPLGVYLLWVFSVLVGLAGVDPSTTSALSHMSEPSELTRILVKVVNSSRFAGVIEGFSLLAIITSLLGVAVGLIDFFKEKFNFLGANRSELASFSLTKALPLTVALVYPSIFVEALQFAGVALAIIAVILPNAISLKRQLALKKSSTGMVILNIFNLGLGIAFIIAELVNLLKA